MRRLIRGLFVLLVLELAGAGTWIMAHMRQASPLLPPRSSMDADTWIDLQELATRILRNGSSQNWLDFADALAGKGFYNHAEVAYRRSFTLDSNQNSALEGIAFCEDRTGRISASNENYHRLLPRITGESRQKILYALGRNALRLEQADQAEELFRENQDFIPARYMYCKLLVDSGRAREAQPLVESFLKTVPRSLLHQRLLYRVFLELNEPEQARRAADAAERAVLLFPVNLQADDITERNERHGFRRLLAEYQKYTAYLTAEQKQSTLQDLLGHLQGELSPFTLLITKLLAEAAVQNGDAAQLKQSLQQLREWGVEDAATFERQGDAHDLAGDRKLAAADWEISVSMTPTAELHHKLADCYQALDHLELSRIHRSRALLLEAETAWHDDQLDLALEQVNQSIAQEASHPWSWYLLCQIQRARQDIQAADRAYEQYASLSPSCLRLP